MWRALKFSVSANMDIRFSNSIDKGKDTKAIKET